MLLVALQEMIAGQSFGAWPKEFHQGTHRSGHPERLVEMLSSDLSSFGVTRLARITGLDRLGIEVFTAVRPNAWGMSVAQGKGVCAWSARASAVMEAIELYCAERVSCHLRIAEKDELSSVVDPLSSATSRRGHQQDQVCRNFKWVEGIHLFSGSRVFVPFDSVHACFLDHLREARPYVPVSTNGLSSGANAAEAILHGICELIERHSVRKFGDSPEESLERRILDLSTVAFGSAGALVNRVAKAEMSLRVWDATGEIPVPTYIAAITDNQDPTTPPGFGAGAHPSRDVALCRAICEAAQSRLTRISGVRDDLKVVDFGQAAQIRARLKATKGAIGGRSLVETYDWSTDCIGADIRCVLSLLEHANFREGVVVPLSNDPRFAVVRVVLPGLDGF